MAGAPIPSFVLGLFDKQDYHNFLKLGKAMKRTAEGLTGLASFVINTFHSTLLRHHGNAVCPNKGTKKKITFNSKRKTWNIDCRCGVCEPWTKSIAAELATKQICWNNTNVDDWPTDAWQLAKPFMSGGKADCCNTPQDTDPAGILQLFINFQKFGTLLDIKKVTDVRVIRNDLMHSSDFSETTKQMRNHLQTMITLLQEPAVWAYSCAQDAIDDIREIGICTLAVNDDAVLQYDKSTWTQILKDLNQEHGALDNMQQILNQQQQTLDQKQQLQYNQQQQLGIRVAALDQQHESIEQRHQVLEQKEANSANKLEKAKEELVKMEINVIGVINNHKELKRHLTDEFDVLKRRRIPELEEVYQKADERLKMLEDELQNVKEIHQKTDERLSKMEGNQTSVAKVQNAEEYLVEALRVKYQGPTVPVSNSVQPLLRDDNTSNDIFVTLHVQKCITESVPREESDIDIKDMDMCTFSGEGISINELFSNPEHSENCRTMAPTKVLIQGRAGIGKSTLVRYMTKQWAKGALWRFIKYVFVINLNDFQLSDMWSLCELLLDEIPMSDSLRKACFDEIIANPDKTVIIIDSFDESPELEFNYQRIRLSNSKVTVSTCVSALISNGLLPDIKVIVASRPTEHLPMKVFDYVLELCGFTRDRIQEYVSKIAQTKEEANVVVMNIDADPRIAAFCHVPLYCNFICSYLMDVNADTTDGNVYTMTDLYKHSIVHIASMLHPHMKYNTKEGDASSLLDGVVKPLQNHADLAKHGMMVTPTQVTFDQPNLDMFGFLPANVNCGFLVESVTPDRRIEGVSRKVWTFSHTTMQAFFGALGLLRSDIKLLTRCLKEKSFDETKNVVIFLAGLLGDSKHKYFLKRLLSEKSPMESRGLITALTGKLNDDMVTIAAVFETQNCDMVDIVGSDIECSNVTPMNLRALIWVLEKANDRIASLKLSNYQHGFVKQFAHILKGQKSMHSLSLFDVNLSDPETASVLGTAIASMPALHTLVLQSCNMGRGGLCAVITALSHCSKIEVLTLTDNDISDRETIRLLNEALGNMPCLKKLNLQSCHLGEEGTTGVITALSNCPNVDILM